jgi:hypothetical protein
MHPTFYIRLARVEEAAALSDLCFRSKAVWGYDPEFKALMPAALSQPVMWGRRGDRWRRRARARRCAGYAELEQAVRRAAPISAAASAGRYSRTPSPRRDSAAPSG